MSNPANFKTRFPEFANVADARVQLFLDDAALLMNNPAKWLSFYEVAHEYHAAHLLTIGNQTATGDSGSVYPISKQEVDDVLIEQAVNSVDADANSLHSTAYGQRYASYLQIVVPRMIGV
jgi:hypothetical protein